MAGIAHVLVNDGLIDACPVFVFRVTICQPVHEPAVHQLEVGNAVAAGFYYIVSQVFVLVARVVELSVHLLLAVAVPWSDLERVCYHLLADGGLLCKVLCLGDGFVSPAYGPVVVFAKVGRGELHLVAWLSHIVEPGVIHYGISSSVLCRKGRVAQVFYGDAGRCPHVVHQPEAVSHLVPDHVFKCISKLLPGDVHRTYALVCRSGLHKHPLAHQTHHIMIHVHGRVDDFSGTWICPRGSHGILYTHGLIAYAGVLDVIRVKCRVFLDRGERPRNNGILEAYPFERLAPVVHGLVDIRLPPVRETRVDVKYYLLLGQDLLSALPGGGVCRLNPPAVGKPHVLGRCAHACHGLSLREEITYPRVCYPGTIGLLRKQQERVAHFCRKVLLVYGLAACGIGGRKSVSA